MATITRQLLETRLAETLSPIADIRKNAENYLAAVSKEKNYVLILLEVLESDTVQPHIRMAASLVFKNYIKYHWDPEQKFTIGINEKNIVKQHIVDLMCRMPESIQKQLIEALTTISEYDFPQQWTDLLNQLVMKLQTEQNWQVRIGLFMTANTIFKRFRYVYKSDSLFQELLHCLHAFQEPLLIFYKESGIALRTNGISSQEQQQIAIALRIMSRIFYSLNWQDLPEYFEDHIAEWMQEFISYFNYSNPILVDIDNEDKPDILTQLLVAIVENINLYAEKYDEEFNPYLPKFVEVVWNLLSNGISLLPKHDELAATCMKFLTFIATRQLSRPLFETPNVLQEVCGIVVTNLQLRTSDEELFEDNPMDFIRRDIEGSDSDSRRAAAKDLIRGLLSSFNDNVTQICMATISEQLAQYKADPAKNWMLKDVSMNLVTALSALKQSRLRGVSEINSKVPLMDFFTAEVLPELTSSSQTVNPILRAGAIKFVSTFRAQMPVEAMDNLFPMLLDCMNPTQFVVHTYAAACMERLLTVKDGSVLRYSKEKLTPHLKPILEVTFMILEQPNYPENDYLMRLIMRVLNVTKEAIIPYTNVAVEKLTATLNRVCANPSNPSFSHYLFEAISALILNVCRSSPDATETFEGLLFPPFQIVLQKDIEALSPYVYQVLAQLLELRRPGAGISDAYKSLFPILLAPSLWERSSNVPAIVKLVEAYMRKAPNDVAQSIQGILGVFQKLVSSRTTEGFSFSLLQSLFAVLPYQAYEPYFKELMKILMMRLQTRLQGRMPQHFTLGLIHTISIFIAKQGPTPFIQALEALQPGMSTMFIKSVWLENATKARTKVERNAYIIGLTRVLCESESCSQNMELYGSVLIKILEAIETPWASSAIVKDEDEALIDLEQTGYEAGYSKLHFASVAPADHLAGFEEPSAFFVHALSKQFSTDSGMRQTYIQQKLPQDAVGILRKHFMANHVQLA